MIALEKVLMPLLFCVDYSLTAVVDLRCVCEARVRYGSDVEDWTAVDGALFGPNVC